MPIYNLLEYSLNYSDTTSSLWFYSKDEATSFNAATANADAFKSRKLKQKYEETQLQMDQMQSEETQQLLHH